MDSRIMPGLCLVNSCGWQNRGQRKLRCNSFICSTWKTIIQYSMGCHSHEKSCGSESLLYHFDHCTTPDSRIYYSCTCQNLTVLSVITTVLFVFHFLSSGCFIYCCRYNFFLYDRNKCFQPIGLWGSLLCSFLATWFCSLTLQG